MSGTVPERLADVLGPDGVATSAEVGRWRIGGVDPAAVALPESAREVVAVLALARELGVRVVPAGAGCRLACGPSSMPAERTVVVSTLRMNRVLDYEPADLTVTVGAGVSLETLGRIVAENGQWLPLDLPGSDAGTIGAALATGTSGPLAQAYGAPRDLALGAELVTGDGRVLSVGGRVVKNVAGFDLVRLAVGSRGTLGILTGASLRLYPAPEADVTLLAAGGSALGLERACRAVATGPVVTAGIQVFSGPGIGRLEGGPGAVAGGVPEAGAASGTAAVVGAAEGDGAGIAVRLTGSAREVERTSAMVRERASGLPWQALPADRAQGLLAALRAFERGGLCLRIALLPARFALGCTLVSRLADRVGAAPDTVYDGGSGVLRVSVDPDPSIPPPRLAEAVRTLRTAAEEAGGGVRITKASASLLAEPGLAAAPGDEASLIGAIRRSFDPAGLLPFERFEAAGSAT